MENKDAELMNIDDQEQFIKNYQAIYYAMNAKPDCKSKLYPNEVLVDFSDLNDLNNKVVEKFKAHYENAGFTITITVSFKDRTVVAFNSWKTFSGYDFNINSGIRGITIVWEYNAKLPQYKLPQKHSLTVRLADELRLQDMLNLVVSGKLSEMDLVEQEFCPIVARVDFINSLLGDELLSIVDEWVEGIEKNVQKNKIMDFFVRYRRTVAYLVNYITTFITMLCGLRYIKKYLYNLDIAAISEMTPKALYDFLLTVFVIVVVCFGVYKIFFIIASYMFKILGDRNEEKHIFNITKGDKKVYERLKKKKQKGFVRLLLNGIFTLIFNVICSIIASKMS